MPTEATAFPSRSAPYDLVVIGAWIESDEDTHHIEWTRRLYAAMEPWSAGTAYVNTLDQDDAARIPAAYGNNYARLCGIKAQYDPDNRFRRNQNIPPAVPVPVS